LLGDRMCYNNILHSMVSKSRKNVGFDSAWSKYN